MSSIDCAAISDPFHTGKFIGNLEIVGEIGCGAYGKVRSCLDANTGKLFAVKSLPQQKGMEIELHSRVSPHKHIVGLERVISTVNYTHVVLEHAQEGDLFTAITERDIYTGNHPLIRRVFLQLIDAVMHCHKHDVYHRDLKPENILVFDGGRTVKLADFGLATFDIRSHDYGCGSSFYYSPECQNDDGRCNGYLTAPNDVWALGVILINLSAGRNPWKYANKKDEVFKNYLKDPNFLRTILPLSKELNHILKKIFCVNPLRRITLQELRKDIENCKYFTRTAEVDQWEKYHWAEDNNVNVANVLAKQGLPSPPPTPRDDRCQSPATPEDDDLAFLSLVPPENNNARAKGLLGDAAFTVAENDSVPESLLNNLQTLVI